MKRSIAICLCLLLLLALTACGGAQPISSAPVSSAEETVSSEAPAPEPTQEPESRPESEPAEESSRAETSSQSGGQEETSEPEPAAGRTLIAYFSCTNNTKTVAEALHEALPDSDLFEIVPAQPYTDDDLNYNTDCRANREQNDESIRPEIASAVENMAQYDVIYVGYPIWWGVPPRIMQTFVESNSLAGKTVIPFCTSGSSGYNDSNIKRSAGSGITWITGQRFPGGASESTVKSWVDGLDLSK